MSICGGECVRGVPTLDRLVQAIDAVSLGVHPFGLVLLYHKPIQAGIDRQKDHRSVCTRGRFQVMLSSL